MIDRPARNQMVETLETYMDEKIGAFEFNDRLLDIASKTNDVAIKKSFDILWYCYDDLVDHKVQATKVCWKLLHRILLLLKSDADVTIFSQTFWSPSQGIALIGLCLLFLTAHFFPAGIPLCVCWLFLGVLSFIISRFRKKLSQNRTSWQDEPHLVYPFNNWYEIFQAAKSVPGFYIKPLSPDIINRRIRSGIWDITIHLPAFFWVPIIAVFWIAFSPLVLLVQIFPVRRTDYNKITFPG